MAFNSRFDDNNHRHRPISPAPVERRAFTVSDNATRNGSLVAGVTATIFLVWLFFMKQAFCLSETDIQCLCQITGGLSGLTLAIPLFLKDFDVTSTFWQQFYLIAITFLATTFTGVYIFLLPINDNVEVAVHLWFLIAIGYVVMEPGVAPLINFNLQPYLNLTSNPAYNLVYHYSLLILPAVYFVEANHIFYILVLFTIYGFYLTLSLMFSILFELAMNNQAQTVLGNEQRIKRAIAELSLNYRSTAMTEDFLLDKLKDESFPAERDIISKEAVRTFLDEMNNETSSQAPKITLTYNNKIIPRWSSDLEQTLLNATVSVIIFEWGWNQKNFNLSTVKDSQEFESYRQKCNQLLGENSGLSNELITENMVFWHKYKVLKSLQLGYTYKNTSFSSDRSHSHSYFVVLVDKFDSRWKDSVAVESLSDNETRVLKKLLQENKISVMANSNKEEVAINI
ncbi:hypothetical protein [Chitinophaga filiformis]|uniref:Uncharacterized protein n=1 Tax=Chitinophaga filiformis TaxID=104663 RepID=A0A1G8BPF0_CHIFI|nr:hypothetical protein [Chitinophaga filiformis]SDH34954.1 hypothetical protein SAMN04488121_111110 [Chitinophaga filiformis]